MQQSWNIVPTQIGHQGAQTRIVIAVDQAVQVLIMGHVPLDLGAPGGRAGAPKALGGLFRGAARRPSPRAARLAPTSSSNDGRASSSAPATRRNATESVSHGHAWKCRVTWKRRRPRTAANRALERQSEKPAFPRNRPLKAQTHEAVDSPRRFGVGGGGGGAAERERRRDADKVDT